LPAGVDRLRQVDDHRAILGQQDVVLGQVAVNHARAQHAYHFVEQPPMQFDRACFAHIHIVQTRRDVAVRVGHELHEQHAVRADIRLRHAHAGIGQTKQRVDLGVLPVLLLHLAAITAAFFDGARFPAVLDLAPFEIGGRLAEAALLRILVDLRTTDRIAAADYVYGGFLAAHQLADDFVDQALFDEREQTFGCLHAATACVRHGDARGAKRRTAGRVSVAACKAAAWSGDKVMPDYKVCARFSELAHL